MNSAMPILSPCDELLRAAVELARHDSGLCEWCTARGVKPQRRTPTSPDDPQHLDAVALVMRQMASCASPLVAELIEATNKDILDMGAYALDLASRGWEVFPVRGKYPIIRNPHAEGTIEKQTCKGECGLQGHGHLDATTDTTTIVAWWNKYPNANIAARVPAGMFALDCDPRSGGLESLNKLVMANGPLPETLITVSGRLDGGHHYFFRRPHGRLLTKPLPGLDVKTSSGYTIHAPSVHPDSGQRYIRVDRPVADPPDWLVELVTPAPPTFSAPKSFAPRSFWNGGGSIADDYSESTSWTDVLEPHGWTCLDADPDADGARWLHPTHTSQCSATVRHGCLFVYSTNTPFEVSEPLNPHGYTRFRAYAVLNHGEDLSAAARQLLSPGV